MARGGGGGYNGTTNLLVADGLLIFTFLPIEIPLKGINGSP